MSDATGFGAADLRKALLKRAGHGEPGAPPESLSAPTRQTLNLLVDYIFYYDPNDPELEDDIEDDPYYSQLLTKLESRAAWEYATRGNVSGMRAISGTQYNDDVVDLADWKEYEILKDLWRQEPRYEEEFTNNIFQGIIFSNKIPPTGRGKSNWLYSLIQFGLLDYPDARVITNNTSDPYETTPEQWADLEHEIKTHDGWMILGIDEAAQFLQYADQSGGKTISQRLKLLRHNRCHIILVAHTGIDIPADIRRQVFVMNKLGEKTTQLGYGITSMANDDRMEVSNELYRLSNIPETDTEYDDIDDEGIEIKFDEEDSEEYTDKPQCKAETNSDSRCPNDAKRPADDPKVCVNHTLEDIPEDGWGQH